MTQLESEELRTRSPENQCLDLLEFVLPGLSSSLHCQRGALKQSAEDAGFLLEQLRESLSDVLKDLFHISSDSSWRITNVTVNRVKEDVLLFLKELELQHHGPDAELDEYDFSGNLLELVKFRNQQYFGGKVRLEPYPDHLHAFGIRACFEGKSFTRTTFQQLIFDDVQSPSLSI